NFFDTADVYGWGHSEEVLGKALEGRRDQVHLATKVGGDFYHGGVRANFDPGYIAFALERSLQRLRTDHVDLYQLHHPPEAMVAGRVAAAERLSILTKPNRTRTQAALRFVLAFPGTSVAIPGAKTVEQVEENVAAAEAPPLTEDEIREARTLYAKDFGL